MTFVSSYARGNAMGRYRNYSKEWLFKSKHYGEHVSAMTGEKLHSKSDIAAELAWRDDQLAKANQRVTELEKEALAFRAIIERPNKHHPDSDPNYVSGFNDAIRLFDDVWLGQSQALKMLLIEKQIETARKCAVASTEWALMHIEFLEEQLKEEKSKC